MDFRSSCIHSFNCRFSFFKGFSLGLGGLPLGFGARAALALILLILAALASLAFLFTGLLFMIKNNGYNKKNIERIFKIILSIVD